MTLIRYKMRDRAMMVMVTVVVHQVEVLLEAWSRWYGRKRKRLGCVLQL